MAPTLISCFVLAVFTSQLTRASHFRGGIITWKPDGNNANKVTNQNRRVRKWSARNSLSCLVKKNPRSDLSLLESNSFLPGYSACSALNRANLLFEFNSRFSLIRGLITP